MEDNKNKATIKQDDFIVETPVIIEEVIIKQDKTIVKKYERGKFLGKGGFAKCYEMKCLETGKSYAAKVFEKKNLNNEKSKRKLINEIKLHKSLDIKILLILNISLKIKKMYICFLIIVQEENYSFIYRCLEDLMNM